jgi:hypothetical protein
MALISFSDWVDSKSAAAFHEAGHVIAMQDTAPEWFVSAKIFRVPTGWSGEVNLREEIAVPAQRVVRYIAGMGCLAEAKRSSAEDMTNGELQKLAIQVVSKINAGVPSFWIANPEDDPDDALPKATCSGADYHFVTKPLTIEPVRDSLTECRDFLASPDNWKRVATVARLLERRPDGIDAFPE